MFLTYPYIHKHSATEHFHTYRAMRYHTPEEHSFHYRNYRWATLGAAGELTRRGVESSQATDSTFSTCSRYAVFCSAYHGRFRLTYRWRTGALPPHHHLPRSVFVVRTALGTDTFWVLGLRAMKDLIPAFWDGSTWSHSRPLLPSLK
jgi:hypothetical protein